jgi:amino acid transporter
MAEVAVDQRRLLKTISWWDGFVIGLANPGFLLVGLWGSTLALGGGLAAGLFAISAVLGALQAYIYSEPAAMFPDKPGGLSVYAREGWRKYFSFAGPIAVFGYWFAWSSVLAVYGSLIGFLIVGEFFSDTSAATWSYSWFTVGALDVSFTVPRLIGFGVILACWLFNIAGMRPAVWFSYVTGALMLIPVAVIAFGAFFTGDFNDFAVGDNIVGGTLEAYGYGTSDFNKFALIMVWLYIIGWSTYGPEAPATFAPEFKDTKNDTRKALISVGALNVVLACLLPIAVVGSIGYDVILGDTTGVFFLVDVLHAIAGEAFGTFLVVCLCAGLALSMNTATMDGSRALYALAEEKMTIKWLNHLSNRHVPARAMTLDMLLNVFMIFSFPTLFFIIATGNLGYMLSHVLALSGVVLLRKDRPDWPRPIKLHSAWIWLAGILSVVNLLFIIFGVWYLELTGYFFSADFTDSTFYLQEGIWVGIGVLVVGCLGYVIAQKQWGRPIRLREPSDEGPSSEVYELMGEAPRAPAAAPTGR